MKRYRIFCFDFDSRATHLSLEIQESWDEIVKEQHRKNREITKQGLIFEYGKHHIDQKIKNFLELGSKPFSIIAFHNTFFEEARTAFVMGAYYPCLTSVCALGERILNHLILLLRDDYKDTAEYRRVYSNDSFDDWTLAINTLVAWKILRPKVEQDYRALMKMRHKAIHFRPETDSNAKDLALEAFHCMQQIIAGQFSGFSDEPWTFCVPGELYIKKEWEGDPFVKKVFLPNCAYVGPLNTVEGDFPNWKVVDANEYIDCDISDDEFSDLRSGKRSVDGFLIESSKRG